MKKVALPPYGFGCDVEEGLSSRTGTAYANEWYYSDARWGCRLSVPVIGVLFRRMRATEVLESKG